MPERIFRLDDDAISATLREYVERRFQVRLKVSLTTLHQCEGKLWATVETFDYEPTK